MKLWSFCVCVCVQAFFDKEYITSHPEDTEKITQLKDLMQEQVRHHLTMSSHMQSFSWRRLTLTYWCSGSTDWTECPNCLMLSVHFKVHWRSFRHRGSQFRVKWVTQQHYEGEAVKFWCFIPTETTAVSSKHFDLMNRKQDKQDKSCEDWEYVRELHSLHTLKMFSVTLRPFPTGSHSWSRPGSAWEAGAPRNAPPAQKADRSVPDDEEQPLSRECRGTVAPAASHCLNQWNSNTQVSGDSVSSQSSVSTCRYRVCLV